MKQKLLSIKYRLVALWWFLTRKNYYLLSYNGKIGLLQEGDTWHSALGSTKNAITLGNILYVHQLQHLLFGLELNSEMEV